MDTFWIVTAESARARIFKTASLIKEPVEVMDLAHPASRLKEGDLVADRPGRSQGSAGGGRHGMANGDAHNHELEIFAREIADKLEQARQEGRYDKVILVAPPAFLGTLRQALSGQVEKLVERSLDKNLVSATPEEIRAQLFD